MFEHVQTAPPDPILGLTDAFKADPNADKINLGVGVYQDSTGKTPVLETVREACQRLVRDLKSLSYLPILGDKRYTTAAERLALGAGHEAIAAGRAATCHAPGGTGALRVAADFLKQQVPGASVWLTQPTWANHQSIFQAAGLRCETLPYFDREANGLAWGALTDTLAAAPKGDVVLLHGCCHNPTGIDPTPGQWAELAELLHTRGLLPLVDFAYQGFAEGIDEDAAGLRAVLGRCPEAVVCGSFSKNFGLYRERTGYVTFVAPNKQTAAAVASQASRCVRANYSNPPAFGAEIVHTILGDEGLTRRWVGEVAEMRDRINGMRTLFVAKLREHGVPGDFSFIQRQRGMFSFSGLTHDQVELLRTRHAIYAVGSGRINVAGISEANVDRLAAAIADVVAA